MAWRVGVDVGGTFTDLAAVDDASGAVRLEKVPTTPADQSIGVAAGLTALLGRHGVSPAAVTYLGHGTTVCINAVLERKGARTGLVTTQGMRDLLELRRQIRDDLYDLQADKPEPVVPRNLRLEVPERTLADGRVGTALDLDAVRAAIAALVAQGVEALAVCFLHSYANPAPEHAVAELVRREFPDLYLSLSSDVLPEFREFERLSTTVMNAYVGPVMARYLGRFEERVAALGLAARPFILQSNGGVATVSQVRERPVHTMASGPSAGVTGAAYLAGRAGHVRIITFDMGGTSTDVSVVEQGTPMTAAEKAYHGYPVKAAMLDVDSIGAGGGSLAWIDPGGFLRVGPQSAGADPGPAGYARGGESPTVTDANLVLGRLDPDYFLGGAMRLDRERAAAGDRAGPRAAARALGHRRGARRHQGRRREHGQRHPSGHRRARPRPAPLHLGGLRRRRAHARGRGGPAARHPARAGAAEPRRALRARPARRRCAHRAESHRSAPDRSRPRPASWPRSSPTWNRGRPSGRAAVGFPWSRSPSPARSRCAMRARTTSWPWRRADG